MKKQTISDELLEIWRRLRRTGDSLLIAKDLGVSRQTIDNAFKFGYVSKQSTQDYITKFYSDRLDKETKQVKELREKEQKFIKA